MNICDSEMCVGFYFSNNNVHISRYVVREVQEIVTYMCKTCVGAFFNICEICMLNDTCDNLSTYIMIYVAENIIKCFNTKNILDLAICLTGGPWWSLPQL